MQRIKTMLIAMIAVLAIGAFGAAAASANSGSIEIDGGAGPIGCDFTFDAGAWTATSDPPDPPFFVPGWKSDVTNVANDPSCDVDNLDGSGTFYKRADGKARFEGEFDVTIVIEIPPFPPVEINCVYAGSINGKWKYIYNEEDPPEVIGKKFKLWKNGQAVAVGGHEACPTPITINKLKAVVDA